VSIPNDRTTLVRLAVRNTGDVHIYDLSPNIPLTLFSTILPIGIVGPSSFAIGELPPNTNKEFNVNVFPTRYVAETVERMNVNLVYNNIIGERATQLTGVL
jgi:hypothetical protein